MMVSSINHSRQNGTNYQSPIQASHSFRGDKLYHKSSLYGGIMAAWLLCNTRKRYPTTIESVSGEEKKTMRQTITFMWSMKQITENGPCELFTVNNAQCMVWNQYWGNMRKHNIFLELYMGEFCNSVSSDHDKMLTRPSLYIIHLMRTCCHLQPVLLT